MRAPRPMLATRAAVPFDRDGWIFEIKWDGYRTLAKVERGHVQLWSRNAKDFTERFADIASALRLMKHKALLDGEVVALDERGLPKFSLLQAYGETGKGTLIYEVFDMLELDGKDMRGLPLIERKALLKRTLPVHPQIRYSGHQENAGRALFRQAAKMGIEGIIGKDASSLYLEGVRSPAWRKMQTHLRQEAVIGGFTAPRGSRQHLGALLVGIYRNTDLVFAGHVGGGMAARDLELLERILRPLIRRDCPFIDEPAVNAPATWVEPEVVCEIAFHEWTAANVMRKPVFVGLREDKSPKEVIREQPIVEVPISHPTKVYWPDEGFTKGDLVEYYRRLGPLMLPYLKGRPHLLSRHPRGIAGESFYQKHIEGDVPPFIVTKKISSETGKRSEVRYLVCENVETLLYMANLGCIEIHPWLSRVGCLNKPDFLLLDLDPSDDTPFAYVVETARIIHDVLEEFEVPHAVKTSGKTGLHIGVPLGARYTFTQSRQLAELLARLSHARLPNKTTLVRSLAKRPPGVYIDYLQNRRGQTMAAPYGVRPVPGATISVPLAWSEVQTKLKPSRWTMMSDERELVDRERYWRGVLAEGIDLAAVLRRVSQSLGRLNGER